jgi:transposase-like protein
LNGEIKLRTEVAGIFPNAWAAKRTEAITRLVGAILLEQNGEWAKLAKVPLAKPTECQWRGANAPAT